MKIGFIGTGAMGQPMLSNLVKKRFEVVAFDVVPAALEAAVALGSNIIHVGAVGAGEVARLCNNLISGSALIAVAEAFRIGEAFGVDPEILTRVIAKSSGATWVMEHMHPVPGIVDGAASNRQYSPGFMTDLMAKDLGLAVSAAREKRVPVVVAPADRKSVV